MVTVTFGNNWGGRMQNKLLAYVETLASKNDVLAFTEVDHLPTKLNKTAALYATNASDFNTGYDQIMLNQFRVLQQVLQKTHFGHFCCENVRNFHCSTTKKTFKGVKYGNAIFIKKEICVVETGKVFITGNFNQPLNNGSSPRVMQYTVIRKGSDWYLIAHFHGVWFKDPITNSTKADAPIRTEQSLNVLMFLENIAAKYAISKVVFGGDFNLDGDTKALALLSNARGKLRYRNLIDEYGITDTRVPGLYRDYGKPNVSHYADYVFVSEAVVVSDLQLIGETASDHKHLEVQFE